jgi:mannosyltransferase OCH1-like enzyme
MAIPKIIHYCWFGGNPIPKMLQYCIDSWKQYLPDYELMLWNESNTVFDCYYVKECYEQKKWAFVSDYIRLKAVYEYGGIYMDTDMLLLKPLDYFLENECFFVAEHAKSIGAGIFGAKKNNEFIKTCVDLYHDDTVTDKLIPALVSTYFLNKYQLERKFIEDIVLEDIVIYEPNYFHSLPFTKLFDIHHYKKYLTKNSYGVHLWHGSWHHYNELYLIRRKEYSKAYKQFLNTVFKEKKMTFVYFIKLLRAIKDSLLTPNAFK